MVRRVKGKEGGREKGQTGEGWRGRETHTGAPSCWSHRQRGHWVE